MAAADDPAVTRPESTDDSASSAGEVILAIGFADRGDGRHLKWAGVATFCLHFFLFAAVIPVGGGFELPDDDEAVTVVRRYKPPEPPKPTKPRVRRTATRVPIPDATPDDYEPVMPEEDDDPIETERPSTDYVVGPAGAGPDPVGTVDIETSGLVAPRLLERVVPEYDRGSARRGVQGKADISIIIGADGLVARAQIINGTSDEDLDERALTAVRQWRFTPATLDGEVVPVRAMVTVNFRIY